ncbi:MAG: polysaccharide deacetylase [Micrococcales bacterium]|nr:polysaccharide deacetylase [Micrococcales bacterium]
MSKEIFVAFGVHVDAVGGWLGSYGGEESPGDISRGVFAGQVGVPRINKLLAKYDLPSTWFWPGHSIETFPAEFDAVVAAGHEIGLHGYSHENPINMSRQQETDILQRCIEIIAERTGQAPTGYCAPWWEFSQVTNELLLESGIKYDNSLMHNDFTPYYVRVGDDWSASRINYDRPAATWMNPMTFGTETDLVEVPASWYLDDLPPMMFIKSAPNSFGFIKPSDIEEIWREQFNWVHREMDYAAFTITIHPDVSGRPQVQLALERLIEHINSHDGVIWSTFDQIANDFLARSPRS